MKIRFANIMDIEKILYLEEQLFQIHVKARPDWISKKSNNYESIKNIIEGNSGKIFVAEDNKYGIIGHCIIFINDKRNNKIYHDMINVEIDVLCVDENFRRKGIGKKLVEEVKIYAKSIDANFIEVFVWDFNQNAKIFYENLGMKTRISKMELKVE